MSEQELWTALNPIKDEITGLKLQIQRLQSHIQSEREIYAAKLGVQEQRDNIQEQTITRIVAALDGNGRPGLLETVRTLSHSVQPLLDARLDSRVQAIETFVRLSKEQTTADHSYWQNIIIHTVPPLVVAAVVGFISYFMGLHAHIADIKSEGINNAAEVRSND